MRALKVFLWFVFFLRCIAAEARPSQITYVDATVCCLAPDGQGGIFVVSWWFRGDGTSATTISVAKLDSTGQVVSTFPFQSGNSDVPSAAAVDPTGNLWIVGGTTPAVPNNAPTVGLILKLDATGTRLLSAAPFGGRDATTITQIRALAFDADGNLYVAGHTAQLDFPLTAGAFINKFPTLPPLAGSTLIPHAGFGFLAKFEQQSQATPPYSLIYSTLLGGLSLPATGGFPPLPTTDISALAVDSSDSVTVGGVTTASDFPVTQNAYRGQFEGNFTPNIFVARFNVQGSGLVWPLFWDRGISAFRLAESHSMRVGT